MDKKHFHDGKTKLINIVDNIYQKLNHLINNSQISQSNLIRKNSNFTDVIQHKMRLANEMNNVYSKINDLYTKEIQMRISRNKIQNYIDKMTGLCAAVISERKPDLSFDPVDIVNMAISSCSVLNKYPKIKLTVPKKVPKVFGNPIPYLQAITMLLNSIARMTNEYIYLKLKACQLEENKVIFELNVDLINVRKEGSEKSSSSFNRQLNYDFFLIRKTLAKINGRLIVDDKHASTISFVIVSTFSKDDEEDYTSAEKGLTYTYNLSRQVAERRERIDVKKKDGVINYATAAMPVTFFHSENNHPTPNDDSQLTFDKEQAMKGELLFEEVKRMKNQRKDHDIRRLLVDRQSVIHKNIRLRNERIRNQIHNESYKKFK